MSQRVAPFGHPLGVARGGVVAYSSHYESADPRQFPSRGSYVAYHNEVYTGFKYQCVEFARRWLVSAAGITFGDVGMAYEIYQIPNFNGLSQSKKDDDGPEVPVHRDRNGGARHRPTMGSLLLWHPEGHFRHTGHVAVVIEASDTFCRVAEQNVTDAPWPKDQDYARELRVEVGPEGQYTILDSQYPKSKVLGWVTATPLIAQGGAVPSATAAKK